jgi:hypothetical protein
MTPLFPTIPISSTQREREFSQMNLIVSPTKALLITETASALLFITVVGPHLPPFDPTKYAE